MNRAQLHPTAERLAAFGLGKLSEQESGEIERHLGECESCQGQLASLPPDALIGLLRSGSPSSPHQPDTRDELPHSFSTSAGATPSTPAPVRVPAALDGHPRYRIDRVLGTGGMGAVFLAEHRMMRRLVALKVVNERLVASSHAVERFRREVEAAARLQHPNIVQAFDAEQAADSHFLVMEYVDGITLDRLVRERGPLPIAEACAVASQVAAGLQHAHGQGLVHRDLKPQNLIRTADSTVKILDFGLARLASEAEEDGLTEQGVVLGTPDYLAPEQAEDPRSADIRADVYSLGCTLYFLLTGRPPFPAGTVMQKLRSHAEKEPESLSKLRPDAPADLVGVVRRMMAKSPGDRPQTPAKVAASLAPFLAEARPPAVRRPWRTAAVAAMLLGLLLPLGLWLMAVLLRVETKDGTLIIKTDDPTVEVVVTAEGGAKVKYGKDRREVKLTPGKYGIELAEAKGGLTLSARQFTLGSGGKETIEVLWEKPAVVAPVPVSKPVLIPPTGRTATMRAVGLWEIEGEELVQRTLMDYPFLYFGDVNWRDCDYSLEVSPQGPGDYLAVAFRVEDLYTFNLLALRGPPGPGRASHHFLTRHPMDRKFGRNTDVARSSLEGHAWYRVLIRMRGPVCECFYDDVMTARMIDPERVRGAVGLFTAYRVARFRNIKVAAPDGKILWQGLPEGPPRVHGSTDRQATVSSVGTWKVEGKEIRQTTDRPSQSLLFGDTGWGNCDVNLEVRADADGDATGVIFRAVDLSNYDLVAFGRGGENKGGFVRSYAAGRPIDRAGPFGGTLERGRWHAVRLALQGGTCKVYLDGTYLEQATKLLRGRGSVGLYTNEQKASFRNIKVTSPAGKLLWEGLPEPPTVSTAAISAPPTSTPASRTPTVAPATLTVFGKGSWRIEGKEIRQTTRSHPHNFQLLFGDPSWGDGDLTAEVRADRTGGAVGLMFRAAGLEEYEVLTLAQGPGNRTGYIQSFASNKFTIRTKLGIGKLEMDRWHKVRVEMRGPVCKGYLDGNLVGQTDTAPRLRGSAGLWTADRAASFRNIKMTAPDGKVLWEGLPGLLSPPPAPQAVPDSAFAPLFNGKDLTGWDVETGNAKQWSVAGDEVIGKGAGFRGRAELLTKREYASFQLRLEFKLEAKANGGVLLRAIPGMRTEGPNINHPELKLSDSPANPGYTLGTSLWIKDTMRAPDVETTPALNTWHPLEITMDGPICTTVLAGQTIVYDRLGSTPAGKHLPALARDKGKVGLQAHTGTIHFRRVRIAELPPTKSP